MKLYFNEFDDEQCFKIDYHKDFMRDEGIKVMKLYEAKRETGTGYFYCTEYFSIGEVGECGKICDGYVPNNGKNGRCRHYGYTYEQTDKIKILKLNP